MTMPIVDEIVRRHLDAAPLTARERSRLMASRDVAKIVFRGEPIASATIQALLDEDLSRTLPHFKPRPWPLTRLGLLPLRKPAR